MTEFQGKHFHYPERITNRRVIDIHNLEQEDGAKWFMDEGKLKRMMRLILDGPHDEVDWMEQEQSETLEAYRGFFKYYGEKMSGSPD